MTTSHLHTPLLPKQRGSSPKSDKAEVHGKSSSNHPTLVLMDQCMDHCRGLVGAGFLAYFMGFARFWCSDTPMSRLVVASPSNRTHAATTIDNISLGDLLSMICFLAGIVAGYHLVLAARLLSQLHRSYEPARSMAKSLVGAYSCGSCCPSSSSTGPSDQIRQDLQQVLATLLCCCNNTNETSCGDDYHDFCCVEKSNDCLLEMEPEDTMENDVKEPGAGSILIV
mmetsp:Transcript_8949/g.24809  ORF Transcript_8949/g.24809 Transcript_8949/m.24809 type:complete len:225 (-) Transcript_8949:178-852(-)